MRFRAFTHVALSLVLLLTPSVVYAQRALKSPASGYATIALEAAYEGEDYSVDVVQVLKDKYQLKLTGASQNPVFEWVAVDPLPLGLTVAPATGQIFGVPARYRPQPYAVRIHVFDKTVSNPSPLKLLLNLNVMRGPRLGKSPTLEPINSPDVTNRFDSVGNGNGEGVGRGHGNGGSQESGGLSGKALGRESHGSNGDIELGPVEPKERTTVAMTIKNPAIRQLEVTVKNKAGEVIDKARTPDDLPRGEVKASVEVALKAGENTLEVKNTDTGELYNTISVTLNQGQVNAPPKADGAGKPATPEVIHSGSVSRDAQETPVKIKIKDQSVNSVKVAVQSKKDKSITDLPNQPKPVTLSRGKDDYDVMIPLAPDPEALTLVTAVALDDKGAEISEKKSTTFEIKRIGPPPPPPIEVGYSELVNREVTSTPLRIKVNNPKIREIKIIVSPMDKATGKPKPKATYHDVMVAPRPGDKGLKVIGLPSDSDISVRMFDVAKLPAEGDINVRDKNYIPAETVKPEIEFGITRQAGGSPVSTIVSNSLNTRAIIGFEQTGASSADSSSKPFLDFFFIAPLRFRPKDDALPRVAAWGQVRLAAVPQQVSTFGTLPANFVGPVSEGKLTDLVQGFDFMAGLEVRVFGTGKPYVSLIPGVKNQTFMNFVVGGGAISPLSARDNRTAAQIFNVPGADSPQRQLFIERYGEAAANKKYIAFVFPDRDRFLRQFYGGVRFKTFYYDDAGTLINRFPAIFDVMIGQNEAVTGGQLKSDVTDEKGRLIGKKRRYVLRLEAFYPFPIKEANFLYLYGTAMMKIGGGGVKINTPLFLNTAGGEVSLTGNDVFIAPTLQTNRDYYRFGIGVNLTELFNREPPKEQR